MKHAATVCLLGAGSCLSAGAALAHGGHEAAARLGAAHWLTAGDHAIVLALSGIALGLVVRKVLRRMRAARSPA